MPQRAVSLAWGIVGLIAVAGVVLAGIDAARAAGRGPAWKRRLLGAGLVLLAALGFSSCSKSEPTASPNRPSAEKPAGAALEETPEWKAILDAWKFVTPLAESRKSTEAQRKVVEEKVVAVKSAGEKLAAAGLITAAEAQLLHAEIANLRAMILRDPPTDCQFTCYDMMTVSPAKESLDRLTARLPLLRQLAEGGVVHPGVIAKILPTVEQDIQRLAEAKTSEDVRAEAEARVKEIRALLARPSGASLDETPEWHALSAAWAESSEVASGKRGAYPFDEAGKKTLLDALAKADADLAKLEAAGLLGEPESAFLKSELALLTLGVQMKRPVEMRMAECYDPMYIPTPAEQGLTNIEERLPLLEKMAASKRISRAVALKVVQTVERDIAAVEEPNAPRPLSEADSARAKDLAGKARTLLARINALLPPTLMCYERMQTGEGAMRGSGARDAQRALLDRLAASGALSPAAAEKARQAIEDEAHGSPGGAA